MLTSEPEAAIPSGMSVPPRIVRGPDDLPLLAIPLLDERLETARAMHAAVSQLPLEGH
jgi:hypothetical protein